LAVADEEGAHAQPAQLPVRPVASEILVEGLPMPGAFREGVDAIAIVRMHAIEEGKRLVGLVG
jgi:hypothetical protein